MESKVCHLFVIVLFFGTISCQLTNNLDLDSIQKTLKDSGVPDINDLEKQLQENGVDLPDLNNTKFDMEKAEKVFQEKCEKAGAGDAVASLKDQKDNIQNCITSQLNGTQIQEELEEAKKTGSMDEVFSKYCEKWPAVYGCVENVTVTVRSCMNDKEEKAFNKTLDIVHDLQEFMCFKDGDRLAMFVAEGGVECVEAQQEGIKNCLNSTVGGRFPQPDEFSLATMPTFLFSKEDCQDFDKIRRCVNVELEKCKDTTPANIVDAFFKFLKKEMPCGEEAATKTAAATLEKGNSASGLFNSFLVTLGMIMLVKVY